MRLCARSEQIFDEGEVKMSEIVEIRSFGDVRMLILQTIMAIRDGGLDTNQAMAMAAHFKVLNDNIMAEVNATKVSLQAEERGHSFGRIAQMGTRLIGNSVQ